MQLSAKELAAILGGDLEGDPLVMVDRPGKIEEGGQGAVSFLGHPKYEPYAYSTTASVLIVERSFVPQHPVSATLIRVDNVREAFSRLLSQFESAGAAAGQGVSGQAFVHPEAQLSADASIGRFSVVERCATIGAGTFIHDQVYIGANVRIGSQVKIFPGARILHDCVIGDRCVIHANVVIGSDGFGFVPDEHGVYQKVPQVGNVVIESDVEIGAGTTIDRATMGSTIIRKGVKLDNLIQIAHNVEIGEHTVIAAQVGVAGSTRIGAHCRIGGQAGFAGHIQIADGVQVQGQSGVSGSITEKGVAVFGSPAIPYQDYVRSFMVFKQLPTMYRQLNKLVKESGK